MFYGRYNYQIDDKGRMRLPAKFRGELGGCFFCLKGYDNTVCICSKARFENMCEKYQKAAEESVEAQRALVEFVSTAFEVSEDSQGRFKLPQNLKEYANLEKEIVIKGVIQRIEVWSKKADEERETDKNLNELAIDLGTQL